MQHKRQTLVNQHTRTAATFAAEPPSMVSPQVIISARRYNIFAHHLPLYSIVPFYTAVGMFLTPPPPPPATLFGVRSCPTVTHQPVEDGLVDQGGHEHVRDGRQKLRHAVHAGSVRPVEHLLEGGPAVVSEGWHGRHHHEQYAPSGRAHRGVGGG